MTDEHGNPLPALDPASSAYQLVALLEYARRRGFRLGPLVKLGDITVQVQDIAQDSNTTPRDEPINPDFATVMGLGDP